MLRSSAARGLARYLRHAGLVNPRPAEAGRSPGAPICPVHGYIEQPLDLRTKTNVRNRMRCPVPCRYPEAARGRPLRPGHPGLRSTQGVEMHRLQHRLGGSVLAAAAAVALLAACGSEPQPTEVIGPATTSCASEGELTMWERSGGNKQMVDMLVEAWNTK